MIRMTHIIGMSGTDTGSPRLRTSPQKPVRDDSINRSETNTYINAVWFGAARTKRDTTKDFSIWLTLESPNEQSLVAGTKIGHGCGAHTDSIQEPF